jgi:hypothetical protein
VWALTASSPTPAARPPNHSNRSVLLNSILKDDVPLRSKCGAKNGTCCKDLKGDDERHLISPEIVRDV